MNMNMNILFMYHKLVHEKCYFSICIVCCFLLVYSYLIEAVIKWSIIIHKLQRLNNVPNMKKRQRWTWKIVRKWSVHEPKLPNNSQTLSDVLAASASTSLVAYNKEAAICIVKHFILASAQPADTLLSVAALISREQLIKINLPLWTFWL